MIKKVLVACSLFIASVGYSAEGLQPYIMLGNSGQSVVATTESLKSALTGSGFEVLGQYAPAELKERSVIIVSHSDLINAISGLKPTAGFLAAIRIGVISMQGQTLISYQNPEYWGNAYLQDEYPKAETSIKNISKKIKDSIDEKYPEAQASISNFSSELRLAMLEQGFGSNQGFDTDDLREYHYMIGMPYFEDNVLLGEFDSFEQAVATIEKNLAASSLTQKVFVKDIPGKKIRLYGIALKGDTGEGHFVPIIDVAEHKHVTFLPYEILIMDKEIKMLHGRFRIALSFPDLTMGTFTNIMSSPGDIETLMSGLTKK